MKNKTLYCDISSHGFGHVAQSIPILKRLHQWRPDIKIVIQCDLDPGWLAASFGFEFEHIQLSSDFGMQMNNALSVDVQGSHQRYLKLHEHWDDEVRKASQRLAEYQAAAVYSNISYLANAAASRLSLPVVNLCSLNWYGVYKHYCQSMPGAQNIMREMLDAYNAAQCFLAPMPSMPMPEIERLSGIGTVARIGVRRADEIRHQFGLDKSTRLVLVSHGGVGMEINYAKWPLLKDVKFLVSTPDRIEHEGFIQCEATAIPHIDLVCSCDAIISKAGYGTYAEAACNSVPLLYTKRSNWPEEVYLNEWLQLKSRCLQLTIDELQHGDVHAALGRLWHMPEKTAVVPSGVDDAAQTLLMLFE